MIIGEMCTAKDETKSGKATLSNSTQFTFFEMKRNTPCNWAHVCRMHVCACVRVCRMRAAVVDIVVFVSAKRLLKDFQTNRIAWNKYGWDGDDYPLWNHSIAIEMKILKNWRGKLSMRPHLNIFNMFENTSTKNSSPIFQFRVCVCLCVCASVCVSLQCAHNCTTICGFECFLSIS